MPKWVQRPTHYVHDSMRADAPAFIPIKETKRVPTVHPIINNNSVTPQPILIVDGNESTKPRERIRKKCRRRRTKHKPDNLQPKQRAALKNEGNSTEGKICLKDESAYLSASPKESASKNNLESNEKKKRPQNRRQRHRKRSAKKDTLKNDDQIKDVIFERDRDRQKSNGYTSSQEHEERKNITSSCRELVSSLSYLSTNISTTSQNLPSTEKTFTDTCWSSIIKSGHEKREAEESTIKKEHAKRQQEIKTYTTLETLGSSSKLYVNQILDCASSPVHRKYTEEKKKIQEESCASSSSLVPATADHCIRETNIVKVVDSDKLRDRWFSLVEQMQQPEVDRTEENMHQLEVVAGVDNPSLSSSFTSLNITDNSDVSIEESSISDDSTSSSNNLLYQCLAKQYPLHRAIINDDSWAVKILISLPVNVSCLESRIPFDELEQLEPSKLKGLKPDGTSGISVLQLAILLDRSNLVSIILKMSKSKPKNATGSISVLSLDDVDDMGRNPLMLACKYASDVCVKTLLTFGPKLSAKNQQTGDGALHIACCDGEVSTVKLLLCPSSWKGGAYSGIKDNCSMRQRLVCIRNHTGKTPLHLACSIGRADIVEIVLSLCSPSCAVKALGIEDGRGYTPLLTAIEAGETYIALHLLEWRCNTRDLIVEKKSITSQNKRSKWTCPLALAVVTGNLEMVCALIECGDPSASSFSYRFDYSGALANAPRCLDESYPHAVQILSVLIKAGANPYKHCDGLVVDKENGENTCPLFIAVYKGQIKFVTSMIDMFTVAQQTRKEERRRDSLLCQKSDAYFITVEFEETKFVKNCLQDALVKALLLVAKRSSSQLGDKLNAARDSQWLEVSLAIMKRGFPLSSSGISQLVQSTEGEDKKERGNITEQSYTFKALYTQPYLTNALGNKIYEDGWSIVCLHLEWIQQGVLLCDAVYCEWMKSIQSDENRIPYWVQNLLDADECYLIVRGRRLLAHKSILSYKSHKLQAAIRFAEMKNELENCKRKVEVHLDVEFSTVKKLVVHCYHGSIVSELSKSDDKCSQQLLDLYFLAEEYLCHSLSKECEMRLLSSNPYGCFCKYCSSGLTDSFKSSCKNLTVSANPSYATIYSIDGPSKLLTSKTVLNILTSTQEISDLMHLDSSNYYITLKDTTKQYRIWSPLVALRLISCRMLLLNFDDVLQSDSFALMLNCMLDQKEAGTFENNKMFEHYVSAFLLQMCLEELRKIFPIVESTILRT